MGPLIPGPDAPAFGFGLRPPHGPAGRAVHAGLTAADRACGHAAAPAARRGPGGLRPRPARRVGQPPHSQAAPLPRRQRPRARLRAPRPAAESVHYVGNCIWYPESDGLRWRADRRVARADPRGSTVGARLREHARLRRPVPAAHRRGGAGGRAGRGDPRPSERVATRRPPASTCRPPTSTSPGGCTTGTLLPRCSALVTVGGKATVLAAAEAGVPMVVVPDDMGQARQRRRVTEAGVGLRLSARACTPERLRASVRRLLEEPGYRAASRRMADRLCRAPGPPRAAELLEGLAGAHDGGVAGVAAGPASRSREPITVRDA
jgi:hypothetical protein